MVECEDMRRQKKVRELIVSCLGSVSHDDHRHGCLLVTWENRGIFDCCDGRAVDCDDRLDNHHLHHIGVIHVVVHMKK